MQTTASLPPWNSTGDIGKPVHVGLVSSFILILLCTVNTSAAETVIVTTVRGQQVAGKLEAFSAGQLRLAAESTQVFAWDDVRTLNFDRPTKKPAGGASVIWLSNGDRLFARADQISNDELTTSWPDSNSAKFGAIPLEQVSAVIFDLPVTMANRLRLFADLDTLPPGSDLVLLLNGDRSTGEIQRLDTTFLELKTGATSLKLDRSRVLAVRMNPELTNSPRRVEQRAIFTLTDGSRITATDLELSGETLKFKSPGLGNVVLPIKSVSECHLFGDQITPLSDYETAKVEFTPFLSTTWPLVRNANVRHGPLQIRGTDFVTGLGAHSRMSVTFNLKGRESEFQSVVGIDDVASGSGSIPSPSMLMGSESGPAQN